MKTHVLTLKESQSPITEAVTKFGGLPVWKGEAQWPLAASSGEPMQFIAQIALDSLGFKGAMAYVFMAENEADTFDPDGGSNAVIIQPSDEKPSVETQPLTEGPRLYEKLPAKERGAPREQKYVEYEVTLEEKEDDEIDAEDDGFWNKIGGEPNWLQGDDTTDDEWQLLLQLDSQGVPFYVDFGDSGVAYAFISPDGKSGSFMWQCG